MLKYIFSKEYLFSGIIVIRTFMEVNKVRKGFKSILILLALMLYLQLPCVAFASVIKMYPADLPYKPPEQSKEELYQDIFISLLLPYIQNEVDKYYSKYLTDTPMVAPYTVYVLSAERPSGYRSFVFDIKLQANSYTGPHIGVGLDYITLNSSIAIIEQVAICLLCKFLSLFINVL